MSERLKIDLGIKGDVLEGRSPLDHRPMTGRPLGVRFEMRNRQDARSEQSAGNPSLIQAAMEAYAAANGITVDQAYKLDRQMKGIDDPGYDQMSKKVQERYRGQRGQGDS